MWGVCADLRCQGSRQYRWGENSAVTTAVPVLCTAVVDRRQSCILSKQMPDKNGVYPKSNIDYID